MAELFEDWCTADGGTELSGVVTLTPIAQQAAGSLTLATVPQPIAVTAGAFTAEVTPGEYLVDVELRAGDDEVRISTDTATQRIVVADLETPQRLRELIDLGVVGVSPLAKLNALVSSWLDGNVNTEVSQTLITEALTDPESEPRQVLDGTYGRVWKASTAYAAGDLVLLPAPVNGPATRNTSGTSRGSFDTTEQGLWTPSATATVDGLTDATTVGKAVAKAADAAAARTAVSAVGRGDLFFNPFDYGAVGDGTTDDTSSVQAAYDAAALVAGAVILPKGRFNIPGSLVMTTPGVNLIGQGGVVTGGEVLLGPATYAAGSGGVNFSGTRVSGVQFDRADAYGATTRCLVLRNARGVDIEGNLFRNCGRAIAVTTADGNTKFHTVAMLNISRNRFTACRFGIFADTVEWDRLSDWIIDGNFFNYALDTSVWIATADGSQGGVDGLTFTNNTMFGLNYNSSTDPNFAGKRYNVRLGKTDWLSIKGNKFFESGLSALYLDQPRHLDVVGNHFAWSGEREQGDCIEIRGGSPWGVIEDNTFDWWTRAAVGVYGTAAAGQLKIGKNAHRWSATPDSWKGAGSLTTTNSFRYFVDTTVTGRPVIDEWDAPGVFDMVKGSNRVSARRQMSDYGGIGGATRRSSSVTSATTIFLLSDVGESTHYNGLVVIQARSSGAGSDNATYVLAVESGGRTVTVIAAIGKTAGAAATHPSFTWTIDASSGLVATPVGSTSGTFFFDATTLGAVGVR